MPDKLVLLVNQGDDTRNIKIGSIEKIMLDKGFIYSVDESNDIKLSDGINLKVR